MDRICFESENFATPRLLKDPPAISQILISQRKSKDRHSKGSRDISIFELFRVRTNLNNQTIRFGQPRLGGKKKNDLRLKRKILQMKSKTI